MSDSTPAGVPGPAAWPSELTLSVGCEFELDVAQSIAAIVRVARRSTSGRIQREQWHTSCEHRGYLDPYGNRCERLTIDSGSTRIAYEAQLLLTDPADVIEPQAAETPVVLLPDEVLSFLLPSRFCLPDELGDEAWQLFGDLRPAGVGCKRSSSSSIATFSTHLARQIRAPAQQMHIEQVRAYAVTSPILQSRSAGR